MNETLVHRGPDAGGQHVDGPTGLAARRLAILDLAHGDQPMLTDDGAVCVVQNGEIFNYPELRAQLERDGVRFRTHCDTEVLLHLYVKHGPDFVERLRGMFAVAIWDRHEERLLLARDRFGIKPLFYSVADGELSFASELKALLRRPSFSRDVDPDALHAFLAFNSIPAPLTIFAAARKLPPGHTLLCSKDGPTLTRYARPTPASIVRPATGTGRGPRPGTPSAAARLGQRPSPLRRPGRRAALRRGRLLRPRRARRHRVLGAGLDVLDRLSRALVQRARSRPRGRAALRHRSPRARRRAGRRGVCCPGSSPPATSRSPTPRRCRRSSSPSWRRVTSRSSSRAREAMSCSGATRRMPPTNSRSGSVRRPRDCSRSWSCCRARAGG